MQVFRDLTQKQILEIGFKIFEYRKIKMSWCKMERMFDLSEVDLKACLNVYKAHRAKFKQLEVL